MVYLRSNYIKKSNISNLLLKIYNAISKFYVISKDVSSFFISCATVNLSTTGKTRFILVSFYEIGLLPVNVISNISRGINDYSQLRKENSRPLMFILTGIGKLICDVIVRSICHSLPFFFCHVPNSLTMVLWIQDDEWSVFRLVILLFITTSSYEIRPRRRFIYPLVRV